MNAIFRLFATAMLFALCACEAPTSMSNDAGASNDALANAPAVEHMLPAQASGKIGAPVDVRYRVGEKVSGGSTTLDVAFIPRVAVTNMKIEFPATEGVTVEAGNEGATLLKASAAEVFRRQLRVNSSTQNAKASVRALVSVDVDGGTFFTVFVIPLEAPTASEKNN